MTSNCGSVANDQVFQLDVPAALCAYVSDAITRLGYLYPKVDFVVEGTAVSISPSDAEPSDIKRDFLYVLYRQKIYTENLELRRRLMEGVMGA